MNRRELTAYLHRKGWVSTGSPRLTPLSGGVSSDIWLVEEGGARFVVKRALPQLKVKDEWSADPARNRYEQAYMRYAAGVRPQNIPAILHADDGAGMFAMAYLGEGWTNWKQDLLSGRTDPDCARRAAEFLSAIHAASWGDPDLTAAFDNTLLFYQLRIEPYLLTTGQRTPALRNHFEDEAIRLMLDRFALVHGDFSPKNLLAGQDGLQVLDCEVAWYGDPAFDVSFFLNHLFLKSAHRPRTLAGYMDLVRTFTGTYAAGLTIRFDAAFEQRAVRLLLTLMLARVAGKSPAEYLMVDPQKVSLITAFVHRHLPDPPARVADLIPIWSAHLEETLRD